MKWLLTFALVVLAMACKDPYDFQPGDPTKPDPPAAPTLKLPAPGWNSGVYVYPQGVELEWHAVAGATFYQVEIYTDSLLTQLHLSDDRVTSTAMTYSFSFGHYFWRVRAASRAWNDYTSWSAPWDFIVPSPTR